MPDDDDVDDDEPTIPSSPPEAHARLKMRTKRTEPELAASTVRTPAAIAVRHTSTTSSSDPNESVVAVMRDLYASGDADGALAIASLIDSSDEQPSREDPDPVEERADEA
jgi:hypothetical protein